MDRPGSGFRRLIGLLVALNIGVLLMGLGLQYWSSNAPPLVTFNADKVQLLDDLRPLKPAPETPAQDSVGPVEQATQALAACPAWSGLNADQVGQISSHLRQLGIADGAYDLQVEMRLGWWVYIPPMANAGALKVVMDDARAKGVRDMAPVRSGAMVNALSLGAFPSLDSARKHAEAMTRRGLRGVKFGPRPGSGLARLVVVQESAQIRKALNAAWPAGLAPDACQP